nr:hypothetical protein CFP56_12411 [Quercus suber]
MFPDQPVLPEFSLSPVSIELPTPTIFAEFTPTFNTDITAPPDEFPNLVPLHSDLEQSHSASAALVLLVTSTLVSPSLP